MELFLKGSTINIVTLHLPLWPRPHQIRSQQRATYSALGGLTEWLGLSAGLINNRITRSQFQLSIGGGEEVEEEELLFLCAAN